jgi:hypothetical protein
MKEEQDMQAAAEISAMDTLRIRVPVEYLKRAVMLPVLEKAYVGLSEPQGLSFGELLQEMEREARKLLRLEAGDRVCPAAAVRFHIHDSRVVHRAELPEMFNLVMLPADAGPGVTLQPDPALDGDPPALWLAPCSNLGDAVSLEPDMDGVFHPCPHAGDDLYVLYAVVKRGDDELYKKYIWLVGFSDA